MKPELTDLQIANLLQAAKVPPESEPPVRVQPVVRPVLRKAVTLKANLTACTLTMYDAREQIANELRRIADMVEEGDTFSESGNMGICDYGSWELPDPWEGPNDKLRHGGENQ